MKLTLAFSPCPNDTFAFHAMINNLIDTEGLEFIVHTADVEELNLSASKNKYDITKLSYNAYFANFAQYKMLRSGSALGFGNGPLFVKKAHSKFDPYKYNNEAIAIPGYNTSAFLLLKNEFSNINNFKPMIFSNIENAILAEEVEAGVIIHEGRFTYKEKGLELIADLGELWEKKYNLPIPLGGIAIKREFSSELEEKINRVLKKSIKYAFENPQASKDYITENAQEITQEVQKKHIDLFVNEYTIDIGEKGEEAINFMHKIYKGICYE